LDEQGHWEATLPIGKVQVSVDNREFEPRPPRAAITPPGMPPDILGKLRSNAPPSGGGSAPKPASHRYIKIPERYYTAETNDLEFTVESGTTQHDIELKSQ